MADLKESKRQALLGDAKARASLMEFVQTLTREDNAKNPFVARSELRFRMRSIRGRVENALPAIERHAASQERERILAIVAGMTSLGGPGHRLDAIEDVIEAIQAGKS